MNLDFDLVVGFPVVFHFGLLKFHLRFMCICIFLVPSLTPPNLVKKKKKNVSDSSGHDQSARTAIVESSNSPSLTYPATCELLLHPHTCVTWGQENNLSQTCHPLILPAAAPDDADALNEDVAPTVAMQVGTIGSLRTPCPELSALPDMLAELTSCLC